MKLMEDQLHSTSALISSLEVAELHPAPSSLISEGGDYPPIQSFADAKNICFIESSKLWAIATPIAFNIWCNYGINSFTNIFVVHIGDIELSAVAIALSVVANFSFGFMVSFSNNMWLIYLLKWSIYSLRITVSVLPRVFCINHCV